MTDDNREEQFTPKDPKPAQETPAHEDDRKSSPEPGHVFEPTAKPDEKANE